MRKLDTKRITQLANHIADNQVSISEQEAIEMVANHIKYFWNSSMIKLLLSVKDKDLHPYCIRAKKYLG